MRSSFLSLVLAAALSKGAEVDIEGCTLTSTGINIDSSCPINTPKGDSLLSDGQKALTLKFQSSGYTVKIEKNGCCNGRTPRIVVDLDNNGLQNGVGISGQGVYNNDGMAIRNLDTGAAWPIKAVNHIYADKMYFWISDDEAEFDSMNGDALMDLFKLVFSPGAAFDIVQETSATKASFDQTLTLSNLDQKIGAELDDLSATVQTIQDTVAGKVLLSEQQKLLPLNIKATSYSINAQKNNCCNGHTPRMVVQLADTGMTNGEGIAGQGVHTAGNKMAIRNLRSGVELPIVGVNHIYKDLMYFWFTHDEAEYDSKGGDDFLDIFRMGFAPGDPFTIVVQTPSTLSFYESLKNQLSLQNQLASLTNQVNQVNTLMPLSSSDAAKTVRFDKFFTSGATHTIFSVTGSNVGLTAVAKMDYVTLYAYAGHYSCAGTLVASTRRAINGGQWSDVNDVDVGHGCASDSAFTIPAFKWTSGVLTLTTSSSVQVTGHFTITYHNVDSFTLSAH